MCFEMCHHATIKFLLKLHWLVVALTRVPLGVAACSTRSKEREPVLDKLEEEIWVCLGGTVRELGMYSHLLPCLPCC